MKTYKHFGLAAPPFDGKPDPRFFCATAAHAETLATLQYAVQTGKACTLVLGDSGSGKTMLGRMIAKYLAGKTGVLWVHGIGQPHDDTDVTICPATNLAHPDAFRRRGVEESTLRYWVRTALPRSRATVAIVDNADGLHPHCWEDILALVTREIRAPRPISVILLGLPGLIDTLAQPTLVRLRRRIFRTCHLPGLSCAELTAYIRHRLAVAGGQANEVFAADAIELIQRFSGGNPALVNQICENALVEAFSEDATRVDAHHVFATANAISGGVGQRLYLPGPQPLQRPSLSPAAGMDTTGIRARLQKTIAHANFEDAAAAAGLSDTIHRFKLGLRMAGGQAEPENQARGLPSPNQANRPAHIADSASPNGSPSELAPGVSPADVPQTDDVEVTYLPLDERLRTLESRLSDALARVREARQRPAVNAGLPDIVPGQGHVSPAGPWPDPGGPAEPETVTEEPASRE
jgi:type II secretory pathway predicted ATPase ExeA